MMKNEIAKLGRADVELIDKTIIFEGFYQFVDYRLRHRLYAGGWSPVLSREVLQTADSAAILLFDPRRELVVLVEQFRSGHYAHGDDSPWSLEIVAGRIPAGEDPHLTARREALEEAGFEIQSLLAIGTWAPSPGQASERVHTYLGLIDARVVPQSGGLIQENEDIRIIALPLQDALAQLPRMGSLVTATALIWLDGQRARGAFANGEAA
jgi:ADP-ribose pyrophosphatase